MYHTTFVITTRVLLLLSAIPPFTNLSILSDYADSIGRLVVFFAIEKLREISELVNNKNNKKNLGLSIASNLQLATIQVTMYSSQINV